MNEQKKEIKIDKAELNENDLKKVDGGIRVVVGNGKMGTCENAGHMPISLTDFAKNAEK